MKIHNNHLSCHVYAIQNCSPWKNYENQTKIEQLHVKQHILSFKCMWIVNINNNYTTIIKIIWSTCVIVKIKLHDNHLFKLWNNHNSLFASSLKMSCMILESVDGKEHFSYNSMLLFRSYFMVCNNCCLTSTQLIQ